MYRTDLKPSDKSGAAAAVIAVHALLLFLLLNMSGKLPIPTAEGTLKVFETTEVPPPPPQITPKPRPTPKPKPKEAASAPSNRKSRAAAVKHFPPIALPVPVPVTASPKPSTGTAAATGAALPGPGTGAGGNGTGTGSGSAGNGSGDSGVAEPPHLATPVLSGRDLPGDLIERWPPQTTVFLRLRVNAQGYVSECSVDRGTGVASLDSTLCDIARERLRFRPALNRARQAVAGWFGYAQPAPR